MFREVRDNFFKKWLGNRKLLRRAVFSRSAEDHLDALLIRDVNGLVFSADPNDGMVTRYLLKFGGWQYTELFKAIGHFTAKQTKLNLAHQKTMFLDIGCHIGTQLITAMKSDKFTQGLGFEMTPSTFLHLQRNLLLNGLTDSVQIFNKAINSEAKPWQIHEVYQNKGANHLVEANGGKHVISANLLELSRQHNLDLESPDISKLFWLDVEGFELNIIQSLAAVINPKTDAIVLEYHRSRFNDQQLQMTLAQLFAQFSKCIPLNAPQETLSHAELLTIEKEIDIIFV